MGKLNHHRCQQCGFKCYDLSKIYYCRHWKFSKKTLSWIIPEASLNMYKMALKAFLHYPLRNAQNPSSVAQQNQWIKHFNSQGHCKGHQQLNECRKIGEIKQIDCLSLTCIYLTTDRITLAKPTRRLSAFNKVMLPGVRENTTLLTPSAISHSASRC